MVLQHATSKQLEKSTENVVRVTHPPVEIPKPDTTDNIVTTVEDTVETTEDNVPQTTAGEDVYEAETEDEVVEVILELLVGEVDQKLL